MLFTSMRFDLSERSIPRSYGKEQAAKGPPLSLIHIYIVGVGGCDPFSEFVPSLFRFGVMYHHFNGGTLSHGSLTSGYIAITSFLRVTGCPLFAAVSALSLIHI